MPKIIIAAMVGVLATLAEKEYLGKALHSVTDFSFAPFTALGVAISLFLGFHNNASYARWWEARTLWGTQIIAMRNFTRFILTCCHFDEETDDGSIIYDWRYRVITLAMAQTHALRAQLRPKCKADGAVTALDDRNRFLLGEERKLVDRSTNPANAILLEAGRILGSESKLNDYKLVESSRLLNELCIIQTACERIHNTSLPFAYSLLVHRTTGFYVFLSPFAMASIMGWWTPFFASIFAYTFFGLDELSRQIQEPFRDEPQCLALSAMCRTMEIDVSEALYPQKPAPSFLKARSSILM
eukprot:scaffold114797_cov51-Attheya_sp.AAC.10